MLSQVSYRTHGDWLVSIVTILGKVCEDIHQLSVPEDVECEGGQLLILSLCDVTGCSETLSCGASDVSNVDNAIMNLTHKWVAVNSTIVKLVIKWNQLADGTV